MCSVHKEAVKASSPTVYLSESRWADPDATLCTIQVLYSMSYSQPTSRCSTRVVSMTTYRRPKVSFRLTYSGAAFLIVDLYPIFRAVQEFGPPFGRWKDALRCYSTSKALTTSRRIIRRQVQLVYYQPRDLTEFLKLYRISPRESWPYSSYRYQTSFCSTSIGSRSGRVPPAG